MQAFRGGGQISFHRHVKAFYIYTRALPLTRGSSQLCWTTVTDVALWLPSRCYGCYLHNSEVDFANFLHTNCYDHIDLPCKNSIPSGQQLPYERISSFPWQRIESFKVRFRSYTLWSLQAVHVRFGPVQLKNQGGDESKALLCHRFSIILYQILYLSIWLYLKNFCA